MIFSTNSRVPIMINTVINCYRCIKINIIIIIHVRNYYSSLFIICYYSLLFIIIHVGNYWTHFFQISLCSYLQWNICSKLHFLCQSLRKHTLPKTLKYCTLWTINMFFQFYLKIISLYYCFVNVHCLFILKLSYSAKLLL